MGDQEVMYGAPKTLAQDLGIDVPSKLSFSDCLKDCIPRACPVEVAPSPFQQHTTTKIIYRRAVRVVRIVIIVRGSKE